MEHESPFLINDLKEIIYYLSLLFKDKCLLTVYFGDNDDAFITTILEINKKDNFFIFHHGPQKDLIEQFLNSSKITFKTRYWGIEVVFDAIKPAKILYEGVSVFALSIPASILWMERREFHRVKLPFSKPSYCQLIPKDQELINLKLYDISLGGFSMLLDSKEVSYLSKTPDLMILYASFEQCKLILADKGEGFISFEIRSKYIINPETSNIMEKIGCKFTRITPAFENTIQRYIQEIEKERRQFLIESRGLCRVNSPASKSSYCRLTLKDQEPINIKLYDISLGGFSMLIDFKKVSDLMILHASFEQCILILADIGEYTISFEIQSKYIINPKKLNRMEKIGCKFTRITTEVQSAIQSYIQQIENENR
jgi:c-di-GMP-binding flagellar brake protein YcgR